MPPTVPCRRSFPLRVVLSIGVVLCLARAAAGNGEEGDRARPPDPLTSAQAAIEAAFGRSDPRPLRPVLSRRLKVYLAADSLGIDAGYYGADQALLILRRVFAGRATVRFALEPLRAAAAHDERTARARWTFRHRGVPGAEVRLSFTLMADKDAWFVREIRELR